MGIFTRDKKEDKNKGGPPSVTQKKKKNILQKAADKSLTVQFIKKVSEGVKQAATNIKKVKESDSLLGTSDYQGDPLGRKSKVRDMSPKDDGGDDRRNTINVASTPTTELQKAAVKAAPAGPTISDIGNVEETEEQRLLRIKRKGRRATKLAADDDELNLSKKALLG